MEYYIYILGVAWAALAIVGILSWLIIYIREQQSYIEKAAISFIEENYPEVFQDKPKVVASYTPSLIKKSDPSIKYAITATLIEQNGKRYIEYSGNEFGILFIKKHERDFTTIAYPWVKGAPLPEKNSPFTKKGWQFY